jgi:uncharacterized membrane protein YfcA
VTAGIINTLAGAGSMVTLSLFVFMGLPPTVANGTNRVGIVAQSIIAIATMRQAGSLETRGAWGLYLIPTLLGSVLGAQLATDLSEEATSRVIGLCMIGMLALILRAPHKWERLVEQPPTSNTHRALLVAAFSLIGVYGGFLQAGIGIVLLVGLVQWAGMTMLRANKVKLVAALLLSVPALAIFAYNDMVHWQIGAFMAVSQGLGAWLGATFLTRSPGANRWVRRLLIVDVLLGIAKFWGLFDAISALEW